jgi:hypothetical protein
MYSAVASPRMYICTRTCAHASIPTRYSSYFSASPIPMVEAVAFVVPECRVEWTDAYDKIHAQASTVGGTDTESCDAKILGHDEKDEVCSDALGCRVLSNSDGCRVLSNSDKPDPGYKARESRARYVEAWRLVTQSTSAKAGEVARPSPAADRTSQVESACVSVPPSIDNSKLGFIVIRLLLIHLILQFRSRFRFRRIIRPHQLHLQVDSLHKPKHLP